MPGFFRETKLGESVPTYKVWKIPLRTYRSYFCLRKRLLESRLLL